MGRELLKLAATRHDLRITHAYDLARVGERVEDHLIEAVPHDLPGDVQVVIDFSSPPALAVHLGLAMKRNCAYVSGVTGFAVDPAPAFERAAKEIAVLHAANMSAGMSVLMSLAAQAAKALPDYKRYITEIHHTAKQDMPSGTALKIADAIHAAVHEPTEIASLRMGDVIGEHRLIFGGPGERLEIVHRADTRTVFAAGALRAATWISGRNAGLYSMTDVLAL